MQTYFFSLIIQLHCAVFGPLKNLCLAFFWFNYVIVQLSVFRKYFILEKNWRTQILILGYMLHFEEFMLNFIITLREIKRKNRSKTDKILSILSSLFRRTITQVIQ